MQKIKVVGFLQNPWSRVYAGGTWPRELWLRALWLSRSGQRLKLMLCNEIDYWWDNATPIVCANPKDVIPPDIAHVRKVLKEQNPDVIIAFGTHAAGAIFQIKDEFKRPVMCLPHPAYRVVTNNLFITATDHIKKGFEGEIRYMPKKDGGLRITINNTQELFQ